MFNRHEAAAYLLGLSEGSGYVIIKRSNLSASEAGDKSPYEGYMDLKKHYYGIISYAVYDPSITKTPFYDLLHDFCGATYSAAARKNEHLFYSRGRTSGIVAGALISETALI